MQALFLKILNMSLSASIVIAAIIIARLALRRAPKKWSFLLWLAAAFRLCCPVSIASVFSLFRISPVKPVSDGAAAALEYIPSGIAERAVARTPAVPFVSAVPVPPVTAAPINTAAPVPTAIPSPAVLSSSAGTVQADPVHTVFTVLALVWLAGLAAMLGYCVFSYIRLRRRMTGAIRLEGNVYSHDCVSSPFILGFAGPRIYIPFGLDGMRLEYVLAHERCHLRRLDHITNLFAFLLLSVHWFNPLVWLAFFLMNKDMEMSCDERVLSDKDVDESEYSETLLSFAVKKQFPRPEPLAFGENAVRSRIKNAMKYKKPKLIVSILAVVLCVAVLVACAVNPKSGDPTQPPETDSPATDLPVSEAPTAEPEPTPGPRILYGPNTGISSPIELQPGEVSIASPLDQELLKPENAGDLFAVLIVPVLSADPELEAQMAAIRSGGAYAAWYTLFAAWGNEENDPAIYEGIIEKFGTEGAELAFAPYWEEQASAEQKAAYTEATAQYSELWEQAYGETMCAEADRLAGLGLNVACVKAKGIVGYLSAEQLLAFPSGDRYGWNIRWMLDPNLTAAVIMNSITVVVKTWTVPAGYNENDYDRLAFFLETPDESGVKNGSRLRGDYIVSDPATWGYPSPDGENGGENIPIIDWIEIGGEKRLFCVTLCDFALIGKAELSGCAALERLALSSNLLNGVDVSGCSSLVYLNVSLNTLTFVDITGCTALESLSLSSNAISVFSLSGFQQLTYADLSANRLASVYIADLPRLSKLVLDRNQLAELDLSGCPQLTELYCGENRLTELDLAPVPALNTLYCNYNPLSSLDVSGLSALESLFCFNCGLEELDVSSNPALEYLSMGDNRITELELSNCPALNCFYCIGNPMAEIRLPSHSITLRSGEGGTVGLIYDVSGVHIANAVPNPGYVFSGWQSYGTTVSTGGLYDYSGLGDVIVLTAEFLPTNGVQ